MNEVTLTRQELEDRLVIHVDGMELSNFLYAIFFQGISLEDDSQFKLFNQLSKNLVSELMGLYALNSIVLMPNAVHLFKVGHARWEPLERAVLAIFKSVLDLPQDTKVNDVTGPDNARFLPHYLRKGDRRFDESYSAYTAVDVQPKFLDIENLPIINFDLQARGWAGDKQFCIPPQTRSLQDDPDLLKRFLGAEFHMPLHIWPAHAIQSDPPTDPTDSNEAEADKP